MAGTKDRILDGSLELFNSRGVQAVTTNHIADHLQMSPGNLYYHYRSKEHIIRSLFERIDTTARAVMAPLSAPVSPQQWAEVFLHGLDTVWRYRFFFANMVEIAGRDELLASRLRDLTAWILDWTTSAIDALIEQGSMRALPHDDRRRLAEDVFIIIWNWTSFAVAFRGHTRLHELDAREGVLHSMLLLMPHFEPEFAERVQAAIDQATA
ncbi:TetR/AcrR family transcriptional regulator [Peterkaempfera bronchialis]|uniref:TetR/AcrR family transcriptional regulator n=1 Tax=Peterkaempfera bronchialis TaxID=2126346 RepID=A0A345T4R0_9ACTN|nr:TetR/AcrR family transcriptional regulator [Peterkaempfera bronchialis]AXI80965.1 TetR/AcrR family transcriptional regulator [Peterkaempfera bronchialis]